ncbi:MAG TPA: CheR family methyltransferase [Blastocatellia bacterium]|nr:CheR family methyltransferase [Blastocatellia bacterium]
MTRRVPKNPFLKPLELALSARYGWQAGGAVRDALVQAVSAKARRIDMDEVSYCRTAVQSIAELQALAEEIAPAESRFFADSDQVAALRERVLPELASARKSGRTLRAWSMACAGGEEPFTLAILLRECIPSIDEWHIELLATDLRGKAIVAASRGRFRAAAIRSIDPAIRNRYFIGIEEPGPDREFDVLPLVRRMVTFRRANVCEATPWRQIREPLDLVLCQNLLLYFQPRAAEQVLSRLADAIALDGYLVVSPIETQFISPTHFVPVASLPAGFFQVPERPTGTGSVEVGV